LAGITVFAHQVVAIGKADVGLGLAGVANDGLGKKVENLFRSSGVRLFQK
jgi:hypothetical protein